MSGVRHAAARLAGWYGANPLHLLALLGCFLLAGYAADRVVAAHAWAGVAVWFVGAAIGHDLVLFPLYAVADRAARGRLRRPVRPDTVAVAWINYLRVPVGLAVLLLMVWFPLILGGRDGAYRGATGLGTGVYLRRWLLVSGALFLVSATAYALALRRHRAGR